MARFRRRRKNKSFRKKKRRNKRNRISTLVVRGPAIIPDKMLTKLKYTQRQLISGTGFQSQVFRGNSLFDPDFTGTGGQPTGFDQWSAFYGRYKVNASSILVRGINNSTTQNVQVAIVPIYGTVLASASTFAMSSMPYSRQTILSIEGGPNIKYLKNYITTKSIRGEKTLDDDYSAIITANPSKQFHWIVGVQDLDGLTSVNVNILTTITFWIEMFRRTDVQIS